MWSNSDTCWGTLWGTRCWCWRRWLRWRLILRSIGWGCCPGLGLSRMSWRGNRRGIVMRRRRRGRCGGALSCRENRCSSTLSLMVVAPSWWWHHRQGTGSCCRYSAHSTTFHPLLSHNSQPPLSPVSPPASQTLWHSNPIFHGRFPTCRIRWCRSSGTRSSRVLSRGGWSRNGCGSVCRGSISGRCPASISGRSLTVIVRRSSSPAKRIGCGRCLSLLLCNERDGLTCFWFSNLRTRPIFATRSSWISMWTFKGFLHKCLLACSKEISQALEWIRTLGWTWLLIQYRFASPCGSWSLIWLPRLRLWWSPELTTRTMTLCGYQRLWSYN